MHNFEGEVAQMRSLRLETINELESVRSAEKGYHHWQADEKDRPEAINSEGEWDKT
jgi:hypothetical protein